MNIKLDSTAVFGRETKLAVDLFLVGTLAGYRCKWTFDLYLKRLLACEQGIKILNILCVGRK